jgi:3-deoxy-D-manno-octulosonic-acid transferase
MKLASAVNPKAKKIIEGQKGLLKNIKAKVDPGYIVWFHVSSVGEFEQARPIIEKIKQEYPFKKILVTFFSPSGYELRKNYKLADYVFYLPFDTPNNVRQFLEIVKPEMVFFVKYEFWFNYIAQIKNLGIPLYLVSGIFRPSQHFFKPYGKWFANHLKMFKHLFIQDNVSAKLLQQINIYNYSISGDTRFDRVYQNTLNPMRFDEIATFAEGNKVLLVGSSWPADEKLIAEYYQSAKEKIRIIIAPHEIGEEHLSSIEKLFENATIKRWSKIGSDENLQELEILIVDSVGKLMHLYQYANVAYVGGGFGVGIHNILEAACFGKPIVFGPNYQKFKEARDLIEHKGAFSINNINSLKNIFNKLFSQEHFISSASDECLKYVKSNIGASKLVFDFCFDTVE